MNGLWECYEPEGDDWGDDDYFVPSECPTCKGSGTVNPLTAPPGFFCVSTETCPMCEGTGEAP